MFAKALRGYERAQARQVFRRFLYTSARVVMSDEVASRRALTYATRHLSEHTSDNEGVHAPDGDSHAHCCGRAMWLVARPPIARPGRYCDSRP